MNSRNVSKIKHVGKTAERTLVSELKARQTLKIAEIRQALVAAGFETLSKQAAVLGVSRSTAWAVLKGDHKASGLSAPVIKRMLASPDLPPRARQVINQYVREKLCGAYGHSKTRLRIFRKAIEPSVGYLDLLSSNMMRIG
jgi:hypothetical protein